MCVLCNREREMDLIIISIRLTQQVEWRHITKDVVTKRILSILYLLSPIRHRQRMLSLELCIENATTLQRV